MGILGRKSHYSKFDIYDYKMGIFGRKIVNCECLILFSSQAISKKIPPLL